MEWQPIDTCPYRTSVDLWCVYGDEPFAKYQRGEFAPIGMLVSNRFRSPEYEWFGNQSPHGVPRGEGGDLKPVAWRPAVPFCPPEIIAFVLGIPLEPPESGQC